MVVSAINTKIVDDLNPNLKWFYVNGSTVAGAVVHISENGGVTMCSNNSEFLGVALQNVADNQLVSVALPPTVVWVNASMTNISVNTGQVYMMPDSTNVGQVCLLALNTPGPSTICGHVFEKDTTNNLVKMQLMNVPNITLVG